MSNILPIGGISVSFLFYVNPTKWDCCLSAIHFQLTLSSQANASEPSSGISSSVSWSWGILMWPYIWTEGTMPAIVMMMWEFWVIYLCSLLVPLSLIMAGCTSSVRQWIAHSWLDVTESSSQSSCLALWSLYIPWSWCLSEAWGEPEVFLGWCIILCCTCHGFALEAKVLQTWHELQMESLEPLQTPDNSGSAGSYGCLHHSLNRQKNSFLLLALLRIGSFSCNLIFRS